MKKRVSHLTDTCLCLLSYCLSTCAAALFVFKWHCHNDTICSPICGISHGVLLHCHGVQIKRACHLHPRASGRSASVWRLSGRSKKISSSSSRRSWTTWSILPTRKAATTRCRSRSSWSARRSERSRLLASHLAGGDNDRALPGITQKNGVFDETLLGLKEFIVLGSKL